MVENMEAIYDPDRVAQARGLVDAIVQHLNREGEETHGLPSWTPLWDILTALRGWDNAPERSCSILARVSPTGATVEGIPDNPLRKFKDLTTMRLRGIIGISHSAFGSFGFCPSERVEPLTSEEIELRNMLLRNPEVFRHFGCHFMAAMEAAKLMGFPVPEEELDFTNASK
mgnify:FL=1